MKYDISLSGVLNTSEEEGTENTITLKQEVILSDDVTALVEGLQGQINDINTKLDTINAKIKTLEEKVDSKPVDPTDPTDPENPPQGGSVKVTDYGAIANDSKSDIDAFTKCFNAAGNNDIIIPNGTFNLPWTTTSTFDYNRILKCKGTGRISIDDFPQPGNRKTGFNANLINTAYEDGFGRFNMSYVTDDVYMSMNMLHEHRSVMDMYHQNYAAVKTRHDQSDTYPKFVPWGQCALRLDRATGKLPSGNVTFNVGKFGVMIYRNSTKKWEFESNPYATDGGFFYKTYDQTTIPLTRTINKAGGYVSFTVPIEKTKDYIVHYWTGGWNLTNLTDIKYAIVFGEVWLDSSTPNLEGYFVTNLGLDMKTLDYKVTREFLTGRFIDVTYKKRRNYMHNIMEANYDSVTGGGANIIKMIDAKTYSVNS